MSDGERGRDVDENAGERHDEKLLDKHSQRRIIAEIVGLFIVILGESNAVANSCECN
jgi:hypothetical protein